MTSDVAEIFMLRRGGWARGRDVSEGRTTRGVSDLFVCLLDGNVQRWVWKRSLGWMDIKIQDVLDVVLDGCSIELRWPGLLSIAGDLRFDISSSIARNETSLS